MVDRDSGKGISSVLFPEMGREFDRICPYLLSTNSHWSEHVIDGEASSAMEDIISKRILQGTAMTNVIFIGMTRSDGEGVEWGGGRRPDLSGLRTQANGDGAD